MKPITFTVLGNPVALKRHRSFNRGGKQIMVDPSKGDKADFLVQALASKPDKPLEGALILHVTCHFQRPKSHYGTGKNAEVLKKSAPEYHTGTPDVDNLIKFVGDALNGIFWKDDSQIAMVVGVKAYACCQPYVTVTVNQMVVDTKEEK